MTTNKNDNINDNNHHNNNGIIIATHTTNQNPIVFNFDQFYFIQEFQKINMIINLQNEINILKQQDSHKINMIINLQNDINILKQQLYEMNDKTHRLELEIVLLKTEISSFHSIHRIGINSNTLIKQLMPCMILECKRSKDLIYKQEMENLTESESILFDQAMNEILSKNQNENSYSFIKLLNKFTDIICLNQKRIVFFYNGNNTNRSSNSLIKYDQQECDKIFKNGTVAYLHLRPDCIPTLHEISEMDNISSVIRIIEKATGIIEFKFLNKKQQHDQYHNNNNNNDDISDHMNVDVLSDQSPSNIKKRNINNLLYLHASQKILHCLCMCNEKSKILNETMASIVETPINITWCVELSSIDNKIKWNNAMAITRYQNGEFITTNIFDNLKCWAILKNVIKNIPIVKTDTVLQFRQTINQYQHANSNVSQSIASGWRKPGVWKSFGELVNKDIN